MNTRQLRAMGYTPPLKPHERRELKRKLNQRPLEPIVSRPGARFYVTAWLHGRFAAELLGPYASHMTALANVPRARQLLAESRYAERGFVSIGVASLPFSAPTKFGR